MSPELLEHLAVPIVRYDDFVHTCTVECRGCGIVQSVHTDAPSVYRAAGDRIPHRAWCPVADRWPVR